MTMDIDSEPPRNGDHDSDNEEEDDPIVATYKVFLKPSLPASHRLLVLQHPNRGATNTLPDPSQVRMKPNTGMLEVDLPIDTTAGYDRHKGQHWGTLLAASVKAKAGGTHGIAGGFGIGAPPAARARAQKGMAAAADGERELDWADAVRQEKVLKTQTLGGICPADKDEARWMVGVFSGQNIHLTPTTSLVTLRPSLHHIDAEAEADRARHATTSDSAPKEGPARAIHMTVKTSSGDGNEDVAQETMGERLRAVQMEPWTKCDYIPGNYEKAFDAYAGNLVLGGNAKEQEQEEDEMDVDDGKGKGKMRKRNPGDSADLEKKVGVLRTGWDEDALMVAVTGMNPRAARIKKEREAEEMARVKMEEAAAAAEIAALPEKKKAGEKMDVDKEIAAPPPVVAAMPRGRGGKARGRPRGSGTRGRGGK